MLDEEHVWEAGLCFPAVLLKQWQQAALCGVVKGVPAGGGWNTHGAWPANHTGYQAAGKQQQETDHKAHLRGCLAVPDVLEVVVQDGCCSKNAE